MTEDGACCTYFVTFSDLQSEAHDVEYVRIPLHYYAKILYVLDPTDQDAAAIAAWLASMVGRVLEAGIAPGVDVLALADIDDVARIATSPSPGPSRRMSATLYFVNASVRHIVTEFAEVIYLQRLAFSVLVMLQSCIDALDKEGVAMLAAALGEMQRMYDGGVSYSEEKSLAQVPNLAFLAVA